MFFLFVFVGLSIPAFGQLEKVEEHYHLLEKANKQSRQTIQFIQDNMNLVEDYSRLSQIILLRHGEPALNKKGWRKRKEAMAFIQAYDTVGIYEPTFTPLNLFSDDVKIIHTSAINRSVSTSIYLFGNEKLQSDSLFREFERKIFTFFNIKLPLSWWLTPSRVFWFMGLNKKGIERFSEAKKRARKVTNFLENDAIENRKSLLVSHGLLNHFLVKYLEKNGWTEVYDGGKGYLSQKMLVRYENQ